ncbi:MAG: TonB-dependent receptor [Bryobacterales bacterium]|nr:TonB-dependent receptor [Bryobacterales bacterium]
MRKLLLCFLCITGIDAQTVTVTAERGNVAEVQTAAPVVHVSDRQSFLNLPLATLGNVFASAPGVLVQQSTYGQVSPFLRGLTGYQVLNLVDGLRFNNSTFRSGPNQYLAFVDPSQAFRVEAALGPLGAQYGSDAMGGSIHVLTPEARHSDDFSVHGEFRLLAASADRSTGGLGQISMSNKVAAWVLGGSARNLGDLRGGGGADSRHVLRRLFGLSDQQTRGITGSRMVDSGFSQYGVHSKLALRPRERHLLTMWYQRSELSDVKGYKDLWGGLGRLRSDFAPQILDFGYVRYEKLKVGPIDTVSGTFSVNQQRDGSVRQGLRSVDAITTDDNTVRSYGYTLQGGTYSKARQTIIFGGDLYDERIRSARLLSSSTQPQRPLYPDRSAYRTFGLFVQDSIDLLPKRLRAVVAARFTRIGYDASPFTQNFNDLTGQASLSWNPREWLGLHVLVGRGFRAPNLNDLGALGLNDLGYEIPAADSVPAGALMGNNAGEAALPSGRPVAALKPEHLRNYELGMTLRSKRLYSRVQVFHADLFDPIVRRTLLFPASRAPGQLSGLTVAPIAQTPAQREQGVVTVATSFDPRAVKAFVNDGQTRYYGIEWFSRATWSRQWQSEFGYSYMVGRDLFPNRNVRRLPPQNGTVSLRYNARWWFETRATVNGAQNRLSGGDLDDERIGASRRRRDIADFFAGSLIAPLVANGVFTPTGETLLAIQNRVMPVGATLNGVRIVDDNSRAPLYLNTAGWMTVDVTVGVPLGERWSVSGGVQNLLDRNYRVHGSGVDAPGISVFGSIWFRF